MHIEKAQESLRAAELCYNEKLYNSTANRAYYAMFQAAAVALGQVGVQPKGGEWSHENLQAVFAEKLIHQQKLLPRRIVQYLPDAIDLRHKADYRAKHISAREATDLLRHAREFLQLIERQIGMEPKAELRKIIYDLTDFILDFAPEVHVKDESIIYEDEHANLTVYPPLTWNEDQCTTLRETIYERVSDLHFETGYLILVDVLMPEQQVAEAERHLQEARAAVRAAEKILAEAQQIGLWQPNPKTPELVPA